MNKLKYLASDEKAIPTQESNMSVDIEDHNAPPTELCDFEPISDAELAKLKGYIRHAKPDWKFDIDAGTLTSLIKRIESGK